VRLPPWNVRDFLLLFCGGGACSSERQHEVLVRDAVPWLGRACGGTTSLHPPCPHFENFLLGNKEALRLPFILVAMGQRYSLLVNVNFNQCNNTVDELLKQNQTRYFLKGRSYGTLTYPSCLELCHNGIDLWTFDEIAGRFTLWLFPAVVLIAHFHYAPISFLNTCAITLHHLSSPIDAMHSLIIRLELQRRCLHLSEYVLRQYPSAPIDRNLNAPFRHDRSRDSRDLAAIWCAYDELGYNVCKEDIAEPRDEWEWLYTKEAAYRLTINRTESATDVGGCYRLYRCHHRRFRPNKDHTG
jgi:hypothetical protein